MNLDDISQLPKIASKTHFAIFVLPKKFGLDAAKSKLASKNTVFLEPKVHDKQKTAIINVDDIAELERITRTKQSLSLNIVLAQTETMGEQAQNKFLKLLEEPGNNIHFTFLTESSSNLLTTVLSRAQTYHIRKISRADSEQLAKTLNPVLDSKTLQQILFLANGLPGEIKKLATDQEYLTEQTELVGMAKIFLSGSEFDITLLANKFKDDRAGAMRVIDLSTTIAKETLKKNPGFLTKLSCLARVQEQLSANCNVRLSMVANLL